MTQKKRDDEKVTWLIVGGLFTALLLGFDLFYSSVGEMGFIAKFGIWALHAIVVVLWLVVMAKFNDPNYEYTRKLVVVFAVITSLIIGLHHASVKEDKQVLIDSKENAAKP